MAPAREPAVHAGARPVAGAALVTGAAALWATFGLFAKYLYAAGFTPLELASVRAFLGFAGTALFALRRPLVLRRPLALSAAAAPVRTAPGRPRVTARDLAFLAAYGIFGFALFAYAFSAALDRNTVAIAVALLYTAPAFVVLGSAVLWRERIGTARWLALGLVLCGVALVSGAAGAAVAGTAPLSPAALAAGLAAGFTYALFTMLSRVATRRYGPEVSLFWCFLFATLALAVVASPLAPLLRGTRYLPALLGVGIVPTLMAYVLYLTGLQRVRASTAAMLATAEPAIATVLAALVLGERFGLLQGAGVVLIVSAAVLHARAAE